MATSSLGVIATGAVLTALVAAGCSSGGETAAPPGPSASAQAPAEIDVAEPIVATYDGGLAVLDGETLEVKAAIPMSGFLRVNPAGDDDHVLVSTAEGFQALNARSAVLTDTLFPAAEPGHVVVHGESTVLFADGSGEVTVFDPHDLAGGGEPATQNFRAARPHHGVAVVLDDGTRLLSEGDDDGRTGAVAQDAAGMQIANSSECPGLHGETVAAAETVVFGCENGALVYRAGSFTKVAAPGEYGRLGTVKGHPDSPVALADFKTDPEAELERPDQFALVDTAAGRLQLVDLPAEVSYSFRSLARGPHAEALILGTDGKLHVVDPASGQTVRAIDVVAPWSEPDDWQQPRPTVFTRDHDVYVTDPATNEVHLVDIETGAVTASGTLPNTPNELSGPVGHEH
ncbi:zinc metallochaperone AztD [soil metagenome]